MKRNIFALMAVLVALVFSAFTSIPEKPAGSATEDSLYWYYVDANGNLDVAISGSQLTKSQVLDMIDCDDTAAIDCARGYSTPQSGFGLPAPSVSGSDKIIKERN